MAPPNRASSSNEGGARLILEVLANLDLYMPGFGFFRSSAVTLPHPCPIRLSAVAVFARSNEVEKIVGAAF